MMSHELILNKMNTLPPQKLVEVIDFIDFLAERENSKERAQRFSGIAEYAMANAGTDFDLDENLEQSGVENFLAIDREQK
jgi:hypothetical protein